MLYFTIKSDNINNPDVKKLLLYRAINANTIRAKYADLCYFKLLGLLVIKFITSIQPMQSFKIYEQVFVNDTLIEQV